MVFLSYAFENSKLSNNLAECLRAAGVHTWMAPGSAPTGKWWRTEIVKAIGDSGALVCLITKEANHSQNVWTELGLAQKREKHVIPIIIGTFELSEALQTNLLRISADSEV